MNKLDKISSFDPNGVGTGNNIYGLPFTVDEASLVMIPVPWEVTVSYSSGTANGPKAIFDASFQVDLYDPTVPNAWKYGIAMEEISDEIFSMSNNLRLKAEEYIAMHVEGIDPTKDLKMAALRKDINAGGLYVNEWVKNQALKHLNQSKLVAVVGGDHSTPLGLIQAVAEKHESFGILHIDAHADLRVAYEGLEFSHASIMYNALKVPQVENLVQVGIRDYCEAEIDLINSDERVTTFFDYDLKRKQFKGESWSKVVEEIVSKLPSKIYLSIDIDGLDPQLCPNTGTPVPGGLKFEELIYLIEKVVESKRTIVGFDLNEVSPGDDEWDANVGARLLYRISNLALLSNQ